MKLVDISQLHQVYGAENDPTEEVNCEYLGLINALSFLADKGIINPSVASYYVTKYCSPEEIHRILGENLV
ncbi:MAG: hypothetical protein BGO43_03155 [Gammaproteobacteria bacterium 39-13]|nr:hypothetical protein [Gammaproteobacteria bacterium]OJV86999.1 MAG: hypothetical protein BGO43_03155 [Gammaproteobacteria bacterium 39-13]